MPPINSLVNKLEQDYPDLHFETELEFRWSPEKQTIFYDPSTSDTAALLHEVAHALLNHTGYTKDIHLIELERDAWEYAQNHLAPTYGISIDDPIIQNHLDTYRNWLHSRSTCPNCGSTGVQSKQGYKCLACETLWKVNDARSCALRRYPVTKIRP